MIHFKNHKRGGFTLIEVMLSIMIASIALSPIFLIYTMVFRRVNHSSQAYDYILLCKNFLQQARQKQEPDVQSFSLETKDDDSGTSLIYSLDSSVGQKSSLAALKGLHKEMVTISWTEDGQKKQESLITFVYKKPEQKKS